MLSLIIANKNPLHWISVTSMYAALLKHTPHEIIGIHDATGLCEAYNRGLDRASGDLVAFSHDDVEFLHPSFAPNLLSHLATHDVIGIAGSTRCAGGGWGDAKHPYLLGQIAQYKSNLYPVVFFGVYPTPRPAAMLDGVFIACRRSAAQQLRFDAATFPAFHGYDSDFSYRAHLAGLKIAVASDLFAIHYSWGNDNDAWKSARAAFLHKHHLTPPPPREGYMAGTLTHSKEEALHLMQEALRLSINPQ